MDRDSNPERIDSVFEQHLIILNRCYVNMRRSFSSCQLTARPLTQTVKFFEHYQYIVKENSAAEDCHCLMSNLAMNVPKPKIITRPK